MEKKTGDFDLYLPGNNPPVKDQDETSLPIRKFTARLSPGNSRYDINHNLRTEHVIIQTRIAGNVREGGVTIVDENTVRISFGGSLNEPMDVVIIG